MVIDPNSMDFRDLHHLLAGAVVPRPIAMVSSLGESGIANVAPMSSVSIASVMPPVLSFSVSTRRRRNGEKKDTLRNIELQKEYVISVPCTEGMGVAMNHAGREYPPEVSEFEAVGLTPMAASLVNAPLIAEAPINFECKLLQIIEFGEHPSISSLVLGQVLKVHIKDAFWRDGQVQSSLMLPIGRLLEPYCRTRDAFEFEVEYTL